MLNKFHGKWRTGLLLSGLLMALIVAGVFVFHSSTPKVNASTTLWPATASPGGTIFVTGSGFPSQKRLKVYFQAPDRGIVNAVAGANGSFSVPLTVPSSYLPGTKYYVHVDGDAYSTQMLFTFARLGLSLTDVATQTSFGSQTSFTGTGFKPNEKINLVWNNGTASTISAGTVVAGSDGSFNTNLTVPSIPHQTQYQLVATGITSGFISNMPISGVPGIVYDPSAAPAGTTINLSGGSFSGNETVNVSFEGSPIATAKTDKYGFFKASFAVPESDQIGYQDAAIVATGAASQLKVKGGFDREPRIDVDPNHGTAGTRVAISGKHFSHHGEVRIYLVAYNAHGSRVDRFLLADIHASANGTFSVMVTIPKGLEDKNQIVAIDVKTGDRGVGIYIGSDNDEGNED